MNNEPKGLEPWQEQETEAAPFVVPQRVGSARQQALVARQKLLTQKRSPVSKQLALPQHRLLGDSDPGGRLR